jgi:RNA polymerase sigma factor (sigma-70 family)
MDLQPSNPAFVTTHWSLVLNATAGNSPQARAALERLCSTYWFPLYAHARRRGHNPDDACDLTQGFFLSLLQRGSLARVGPEKGRFRTFLLKSLSYFLADAADHQNTLRRGGGSQLIELDALEAEDRYALEPATEETPDKAFDRRWVAALMARALASLEAEQREAGKAENFARLKPFLGREPEQGEYETVARPLGVTPNAIAAAVRRLRLRLRELALAEVAQTLASPAEAEAELRALLG